MTGRQGRPESWQQAFDGQNNNNWQSAGSNNPNLWPSIPGHPAANQGQPQSQQQQQQQPLPHVLQQPSHFVQPQQPQVLQGFSGQGQLQQQRRPSYQGIGGGPKAMNEPSIFSAPGGTGYNNATGGMSQQQQQHQRQQSAQSSAPGNNRTSASSSASTARTGPFPQFAPGSFPAPPMGWHNNNAPSVLTPTGGYDQQQQYMAVQQGSGSYGQPQSHLLARSGQQQQQHLAGPPGPSGGGNFVGGPGGKQFPPGNFGFDEEADEDDFKKKGLIGQKIGTSDFVKKLFTMLDDLSYASIVSWSALGDSFIVRNMNDFTKHVLPRHFRHSNFASFVRQLNKYDFHKVKNPGEQSSQPADQVWEFKHPDFVRGREDLLENVRRKLPSGKKKADDDREGSPTMPNASDAATRGAQGYQKLKEEIADLTSSRDQMASHIAKLTKQYQGVIGEMLTFQRNMVQQDQLMQNLIQYLMNLEQDRKVEGSTGPGSSTSMLSDGPFVSPQDASRLVGSYEQVAEAAFGQMSELAHRANQQPMSAHSSDGTTASAGPTPGQSSLSGATPLSRRRRSTRGDLSPKSITSGLTPNSTAEQEPNVVTPGSSASHKAKATDAPLDGNGQGHSQEISLHPPHLDDEESASLFNTAANSLDNPSLAAFEGAGLRVFTVGTLQPRSDAADNNGEGSSNFVNRLTPHTEDGQNGFGISVPDLEDLPTQMPKLDQRTSSGTTPGLEGENGDSRSGTPSDGSNMLRVRRSTYVPGWAVPPRVLLVDDDAVCRKLSSKFLQVFGCATDVAVDGVNAVNKMNLQQYDLVLMDIVMPNLDGVSATSLIREFDPRTPIISMTSNSAPSELVNYMSSGMNDILPKPFTKEGLLSMLEKHLIHLKTVQKMDQIPKQLGLPPVSKDVLQNVLSATAASAAAVGLPDRSKSSSSPGQGSSRQAVPNAAGMGNGPGAVKLEDGDASAQAGEDSNLVNPLAGMGFSDEEYISMIQSLIAAGSVSGEMANDVAELMGVTRGEGTGLALGAGSSSGVGGVDPFSASSVSGGKKRTAESPLGEGDDEKRAKGRFTDLRA